ncbi:MAG: hypothetical protein JSR18_16220 [Proteobacteria bacterium]|nr:hypothetical protein [Pseudomonadota bacterium]
MPAAVPSPPALTLVVPAPVADGSAQAPRWAGFGDAEPLATGVVHAALDALGLPRDAAGPLVARGLGIDVAAGDAWAVATPVVLAIHGDDVRIAARAHPSADATAATLAALNAHFADDGIAFVAPARDTWLARFAAPPAVMLAPFDAALGGSLYAHRPTGPDGRRVERWANEMQMLLHAQNDRSNLAGRARQAGDGAPDAIWWWGLGTARDAPPGHARGWADAGSMHEIGALARGLGSPRAVPADFAAWLAGARGTVMRESLVVLSSAHAGAHWIEPALHAWRTGALRALTLLAIRDDGTVFRVRPYPSLLARLRRRLQGHA